MFSKKNGKKAITVLLVLSCVVSGFILASSPAEKQYVLRSHSQIDSLINLHFQESLIEPSQIQTSTIQIDTIFTRKNYQVRVPSSFSKTVFHIYLNKDMSLYEIDTPAKVRFPSRDMHIHLYKHNTILRTIHLTTDTDLDSLSTTE
ncbi:hypothetical protein [Gracilimonas sp.]|uniref:hypothetical protein n=1 Tax=Gracilimonas sp. TaxID=1974203 RepID=UPI00287255B0|nr:hypothetical protein [Gracilimonas sp.]